MRYITYNLRRYDDTHTEAQSDRVKSDGACCVISILYGGFYFFFLFVIVQTRLIIHSTHHSNTVFLCQLSVHRSCLSSYKRTAVYNYFSWWSAGTIILIVFAGESWYIFFLNNPHSFSSLKKNQFLEVFPPFLWILVIIYCFSSLLSFSKLSLWMTKNRW